MSLIRRSIIGKNKRASIYVPPKKHKKVEVVRKAEEPIHLPPVVSEAQTAVKQAEAAMKKTKESTKKPKRTYKKRTPTVKKKGVKKTAMKKKSAGTKKSTKKIVKRRKITSKAHIFDLIKALKNKK